MEVLSDFVLDIVLGIICTFLLQFSKSHWVGTIIICIFQTRELRTMADNLLRWGIKWEELGFFLIFFPLHL